MSLVALLTAVRNELRTGLNLVDTACTITPDGQPLPSWMGDQCLNIHAGSWVPGGKIDRGLDEEFSVNVTINRRLPFPIDRIPENVYLTNLTGMEAVARKIAIRIHQSYVVLEAANVLITEEDVSKFIETLLWVGTDPAPRVETGEYLYSDNPDHVNKPAALSMTVRFSGARRMQSYATMA